MCPSQQVDYKALRQRVTTPSGAGFDASFGATMKVWFVLTRSPDVSVFADALRSRRSFIGIVTLNRDVGALLPVRVSTAAPQVAVQAMKRLTLFTSTWH